MLVPQSLILGLRTSEPKEPHPSEQSNLYGKSILCQLSR